MSGREGQEWHLKRNSPFRESSYIRDHNYRRKTKAGQCRGFTKLNKMRRAGVAGPLASRLTTRLSGRTGMGTLLLGRITWAVGDMSWMTATIVRSSWGGCLSCWAFIPSLWIRPLWDTMRLPLVKPLVKTTTSHDPSQWTMLQGISSTPPMPMTRCANQPHPPTSNKF